MESKKCANCGGEMPSKNKRYCSRACRDDGRKVKIRKICKRCKKEFHVNNYQHLHGEGVYCSRECKHKDTCQKVVVICAYCGKGFKVKPMMLRRKHPAKYCSNACRNKCQRGENHFAWKNGQFPYYGENWRPARRKARERDNYTCQICGTKEEDLAEELSVHHKVSIREFSVLEDANKLSNLISVCRACHGKIERGSLKGIFNDGRRDWDGMGDVAGDTC